jgi:hypothetical protein
MREYHATICEKLGVKLPGLTRQIRVIQRKSYGFRDEEYLKLKILTMSLPELENP